eukprot:2959883-Heterocapsa_arctica.AAC.2
MKASSRADAMSVPRPATAPWEDARGDHRLEALPEVILEHDAAVPVGVVMLALALVNLDDAAAGPAHWPPRLSDGLG